MIRRFTLVLISGKYVEDLAVEIDHLATPMELAQRWSREGLRSLDGDTAWCFAPGQIIAVREPKL